MAKIGLMTWFTYDNHGSLLQCRALMRSIEKLGYDVDLVNYTPKEPYSNKPLMKTAIHKVSGKLKSLNDKSRGLSVKNEKSMQFREILSKSPQVETKSELFALNREYDSFVCGSDQIWAPTVFDDNYFLSFVDKKSRKVAYAPSIGLPVIENPHVRERMKQCINDFEYLSTREEKGAELIRELTGKEAKVVLDPTLLLSRAEWEKEMVQVDKKNYILCYFLGDNQKHYETCVQIARRLNKELIVLPVRRQDLLKPECTKEDIGPREFISLIDNADMILTDSFHGTIFSINFNKPVVVFKRFKDNALSQNSRIYNILKKLNLESLLFEADIERSIEAAKNVNFFDVNQRLEELREDSLDYLERALRESSDSNRKDDKVITKNCCGCGMCTVVCPQKCIQLKLNENGFYHYEIDQERCIHCNMCSTVCGQAGIHGEMIPLRACELYSACAVDEEVLKKSTSGGICSTISSYELANGGNVIGCKYDYEKNIAYLDVDKSETAVNKTKGSKYLQAYPVAAYKQLKEMNRGVVVGTPCQIGSVDLYLKKMKKRDDFLLVEFICHGVPTYHLWNKYIKEFQNVTEIEFRSKSEGWGSEVIKIQGKGLEYAANSEKDLFYRFFELSNTLNSSCYECNYREKSVADIKVGDYWGPKFKANKAGMSMVIPVTSRGMLYLEDLRKKNLLHIQKEEIEDYFKYQQIANMREPLEYRNIIADLKNETFSLKSVDRKYNTSANRIKKLRRFYYKLKGM